MRSMQIDATVVVDEEQWTRVKASIQAYSLSDVTDYHPYAFFRNLDYKKDLEVCGIDEGLHTFYARFTHHFANLMQFCKKHLASTPDVDTINTLDSLVGMHTSLAEVVTNRIPAIELYYATGKEPARRMPFQEIATFLNSRMDIFQKMDSRIPEIRIGLLSASLENRVSLEKFAAVCARYEADLNKSPSIIEKIDNYTSVLDTRFSKLNKIAGEVVSASSASYFSAQVTVHATRSRNWNYVYFGGLIVLLGYAVMILLFTISPQSFYNVLQISVVANEQSAPLIISAKLMVFIVLSGFIYFAARNHAAEKHLEALYTYRVMLLQTADYLRMSEKENDFITQTITLEVFKAICTEKNTGYGKDDGDSKDDSIYRILDTVKQQIELSKKA